MPVSDAVVESISGSIGSVVALLATYPLKTIYTAQALSSSDGQAGAVSALDIIRRYRLSGLYVGIAPNIVESALSSGVYFYLYSRLRDVALASSRARRASSGTTTSSSKEEASIGVLASLVVAALAGAGNQLVTLPASVISTRMLAKKKEVADAAVAAAAARQRGKSITRSGKEGDGGGVLAVMGDIFNESGIGGFWKGLLPTLVLVANPAIQFMLYEQLLRLLRSWKQKKAELQAIKEAEEMLSGTDGGKGRQPAPVAVRLSSAEIFLASALAKIGATVVTYPLLVVKSRMQASSKGTGTLETIFRMWQGEGPTGFFKGLRAKILQTALNAALMLMLKEQMCVVTRSLLASPKDLVKSAVNHSTVAAAAAILTATANGSGPARALIR